MIQDLCFREIEGRPNFTKIIAGFFLYVKIFLFSQWLPVFKTSNTFSEKIKSEWAQFYGLHWWHLLCSYKHEIFNGLEQAKLYNSVHKHTNIVPPVLKDIYWHLAIYMRSSTFKTGLFLKILLPCYMAWLKIINYLHCLMALPNYQQ